MPSPVRFEVKGLRQLGDNFAKLEEAVQRRLAGRATGAAARIVKEAAKNKVRSNPTIDTGSLLDAIISKKLGKSAAGELTAAHIVTARHRRSRRKTKGKQSVAPHILFTEFGTVNMPAEPVLAPALSENLGRAADAMRDALGKGLAAEARKLPK